MMAKYKLQDIEDNLEKYTKKFVAGHRGYFGGVEEYAWFGTLSAGTHTFYWERLSEATKNSLVKPRRY